MESLTHKHLITGKLGFQNAHVTNYRKLNFSDLECFVNYDLEFNNKYLTLWDDSCRRICALMRTRGHCIVWRSLPSFLAPTKKN